MNILRNITIAACMVSISQAATVTVDSGFTTGITDGAGVDIAAGTGSISLGYFATLSDSAISGTFDSGTLTADFQVYAGNTTTFGKFGFGGLFSISSDAGEDFGSDFVGNNIYLFAHKRRYFNFNEEIWFHDDMLVYKFAETFKADPGGVNPPSSQTLFFDVSNASNFVVGTNYSTLDAPLTGQAGRMSYILEPTLYVPPGTPEPSSTALLGLGGLALMLRRRR